MKRATAVFGVLLLPVVAAVVLAFGLDDRERIAEMLNLDAAPDSLVVASCASDAWTDVSITCAIRIAPDQFPLLLRGYDFTRSQVDQSSFSLGLPKLGDEFFVAVAFEATPSTFTQGRLVGLYADARQERVLVHLYIE